MAQELLPIAATNLGGNEVLLIQEGGPGGTGTFIPVNVMRNSAGYTTIAGASVTGTVAMPNNCGRYIITSQPSAATIQLPANPTDGQMAEVVNGTAAAFATNVVTINVGTSPASVTLVGGAVTITTLGAGASVEFQYSLATNSWYRLR